uniref:START domain-containing protein n=1 Tax=Noctiluca scintillans TaxID=2966 RepID=A0A7S1ANQ8_NOCSC
MDEYQQIEDGESPETSDVVHRQFGTSMQLAHFFMNLSAVFCVSATFEGIGYLIKPLCGPSGVDPSGCISYVMRLVLRIDFVMQVTSQFIFLIGGIGVMYACHPKRLLLQIGYDHGRTANLPKNFFKRHFGTELLLFSHFQVSAMIVYIAAGVVEVFLVDGTAFWRQGFWWMIVSAKDSLGWNNILMGVAGTFAMIVLNRGCYPHVMIRPQSPIAKFWDNPIVEQWLGRKKAEFCKVHFGSTEHVVGWLILVGGILWLLDAIGTSASNFLAASTTIVSGIMFLRVAHNQEALLHPVLFGCHRCPLPSEHPMGPLFNSVAIKTDIDAGLDAAAAVLDDLPWQPLRDGVWLVEQKGLSALKVEMDVGLHPFALAQLMKSVEVKQEDPTVEEVKVVETLTDNASIMYTCSQASPPMPRSDQVFVSALRESADDHIIVAEWAVQDDRCPTRPQVARQHPFVVQMMLPVGTDSTHLTVCVVVNVADWMPPLMVREELEKGATELFAMRDLPGSKDGNELVAGIQQAIWASVAEASPPCFWTYFQSIAAGVKAFKVPPSASKVLPSLHISTQVNPCDVLGSSSVHDPLHVGAVALQFSNIGSWKQQRLIKPWTKRDTKPSLAVHSKVSGAVRASTTVKGVHPVALAFVLQSAEVKRMNDPSIVELREVEKVSDCCSIYYQRSRVGKLLEERDAVYASMIVDVDPNVVLLVEWPVDWKNCPEEGLCGHRAKSFYCYEARRARGMTGGVNTLLTVSVVVNMGGALGSRFLRPAMCRATSSGLFDGLAEMSSFFVTSEGREALAEVEKEIRSEVCRGLRAELPPSALSFMECYSEVLQQCPDALPRILPHSPRNSTKPVLQSLGSFDIC